ncbi:MAG: hypothetical protein JWP29_3005 [Rhodoferax sp.]|nr:hypothetical protein [Rhodoferax sp.]
MFRLSGMLLLATVSIAAMFQTASPLVGKWGGTMKMANGNENDVVLVIRPDGGTWRFFSRGKG